MNKNPDKLVTFTPKNLLNNEHIVDSRSTAESIGLLILYSLVFPFKFCYTL